MHATWQIIDINNKLGYYIHDIVIHSLVPSIIEYMHYIHTNLQEFSNPRHQTKICSGVESC